LLGVFVPVKRDLLGGDLFLLSDPFDVVQIWYQVSLSSFNKRGRENLFIESNLFISFIASHWGVKEWEENACGFWLSLSRILSLVIG
jgi:hypothetical protein